MKKTIANTVSRFVLNPALRIMSLFFLIILPLFFVLSTVLFEHNNLDYEPYPINNSTDCDDIDRLGERDFRNFISGVENHYPLPEMCNFKYFYGVVGSDWNNQKFADFCDDMERKLPDKTWKRCVFGLGHGLGRLLEIELKKTIFDGKVNELFKLAKVKCADIFSDLSFEHCVLGVYNYVGIEVALRNKNYVVDLNNPFSICFEEEARYKRYCYNQLVAPVFDLTGRDLEKSFGLVFKIPREEESEIYDIMSTMASYMAFINTNFDEVYSLCLNLPDSKQIVACVRGYASGLIEIAPETVSYDYAYKSCMSYVLSLDLKIECIARAFEDQNQIEDQKLVAKPTCETSVEEIYKKYCILVKDGINE